MSGLEIEQLEVVALAVSKQRAAGDLREGVTKENLRSLPVQSLTCYINTPSLADRNENPPRRR